MYHACGGLRVSNFLRQDSEGDSADAEPADSSFAGSLHTQLRDSARLAVKVQLFHARVGRGSDRIHVLGFKEESDNSGTIAALPSQLQQESPCATSSEDGSSLGHSTGGASVPCECDLCVSFEIGDGHAEFNDEEDAHLFVTKAISPALQVILGVPSHGQDVCSLFDRREAEALEEWIHDEFVTWAHGQTTSRKSKWCILALPTLRQVGVRASARCRLNYSTREPLRSHFGSSHFGSSHLGSSLSGSSHSGVSLRAQGSSHRFQVDLWARQS